MSAADPSLPGLPVAPGVEATLRELPTRYGNRLLLITRLRGIRPEDCDDIVQDTLLVAVQGLRSGRFRGDSSISTWLIGILEHRIQDYWRRQKARRVSSSVDPDQVADRRRTPETSDLSLQVEQTLRAMPRLHALVLILSQHFGLSGAEIAALVGVSPGRVFGIVSEAKRMFRRKFLAEREDSGPAARLED